MSNFKISELPAASSVGSSDVMPIVQNGETKKIAYATLAPEETWTFTLADGTTVTKKVKVGV